MCKIFSSSLLRQTFNVNSASTWQLAECVLSWLHSFKKFKGCHKNRWFIVPLVPVGFISFHRICYSALFIISCHVDFFFFICLHIWKVVIESNGNRGRREIFHLLVPSKNAHNSWLWIQLKPGAWNSFWISSVGAGNTEVELSSTSFWLYVNRSWRISGAVIGTQVLYRIFASWAAVSTDLSVHLHAFWI